MPTFQDFTSVGSQPLQIPDDMYSMTIRLWGAGGGGEHIANNGTVRAGGTGGDTTFLGFTAEGGGGGGRNADQSVTKNVAGIGGDAVDGGNWAFYGASVALVPGANGQVPDGSTVTTTTATLYERIAIERYKNTNPSSAYFGDHFSSTAAPPDTDWAFDEAQGFAFLNQAPGTVEIVDDEDDDQSDTNRPYSGGIGFVYTDLSQAPADLDVRAMYALSNGSDTKWSIDPDADILLDPSYSLVQADPIFWMPLEDLTVTTETTTSTGNLTDPQGGVGGTLGGLDSKDGGDGSNDQVVFYSSMNHVFNDTTDTNIVTDSSPDVSIATENQTAPGGLPCGTFNGWKRYGITFNFPYDNSSYTFTMLNFQQQAAGGSTVGPFQFAGTSNKTASSIKAYFCRVSKNSYIRGFTFQTSGKKSSHRGAGGGGSAHVRAFIDRETLENHPTYSLGETYDVVVGGEGIRGQDNVNPQGVFTTYSRAESGERGRAEVEFIIRASATLKDRDNPTANPTQLLAGQILTLEWTTGGDNGDGTFLQQDGLTLQEVLNNSTLDVSPNETTTYSIVTSGLGGTASSDLVVEVYQPPQLTVSIPTDTDWGVDFDLNVETNYANSSVTATYVQRYFDGTTETIVVNGTPNSSASIQEDLVQDLGPEINWTPLGPETIDVTVSISGTGGVVTQSDTITVNIDRLPDNINIPDNKDEIPSDEVEAPDDDTVVSDPIVITGIDIPVEIKSNFPIQVRFDDDDPNLASSWKDVQEI